MLRAIRLLISPRLLKNEWCRILLLMSEGESTYKCVNVSRHFALLEIKIYLDGTCVLPVPRSLRTKYRKGNYFARREGF
jgi:hypothetical protein